MRFTISGWAMYIPRSYCVVSQLDLPTNRLNFKSIFFSFRRCERRLFVANIWFLILNIYTIKRQFFFIIIRSNYRNEIAARVVKDTCDFIIQQFSNYRILRFIKQLPFLLIYILFNLQNRSLVIYYNISSTYCKHRKYRFLTIID